MTRFLLTEDASRSLIERTTILLRKLGEAWDPGQNSEPKEYADARNADLKLAGELAQRWSEIEQTRRNE